MFRRNFKTKTLKTKNKMLEQTTEVQELVRKGEVLIRAMQCLERCREKVDPKASAGDLSLFIEINENIKALAKQIQDAASDLMK